MIVFNAAIILCRITKVKNNVFPSLGNQIVLDYRVQGCQITEVVFYTKVLINDILVGLERMLDYIGVGLDRYDCTSYGLMNLL